MVRKAPKLISLRTNTYNNLSHALESKTTTRIICRTARLIDVCRFITLLTLLFFVNRAAKVRAFL